MNPPRTLSASDRSPEFDWINIVFLAAVHLLAVVAVLYLALVHFSWWSVGLGFLWFGLCGLSVTGGYHRLFSHRTYGASWPLRAFYLAFGAAAVQNSALKWSSDHRRHHARTDTEDDPYNIQRGFWWAHIGWIFYKDPRDELASVRDLEADPLVRFQHRHYLAIAVLFAAVLPFGLGFLWGDPWGALLVAGFLRLVVQWHSTFAVNSVAHWTGARPYQESISARDSLLTVLVTLGEGYHNFHHRFPRDYRNGIRWFHLDPTKWFVWLASHVGLTRDLKLTPPAMIRAARADREHPVPHLRRRAPVAATTLAGACAYGLQAMQPPPRPNDVTDPPTLVDDARDLR